MLPCDEYIPLIPGIINLASVAWFHSIVGTHNKAIEVKFSNLLPTFDN